MRQMHLSNIPKKTFACIDAHTCGNPVRVVVGGVPWLEGQSMFEKRQHFLQNFDWIRQGLLFEPRGHDMQSGSMLFPSTDERCDAGIVFIETSGCLPMCGHGTIGTVTVAIEHGLVCPKTQGILNLETPAGFVQATYELQGERVKSVKIRNVPSFLHSKDLQVESKFLGCLTFDVAYGGNFYAIVEKQENFQDMGDYSVAELIEMARDLRMSINNKYQFQHPENPDIQGLSHIQWTGQPRKSESTARNAVFYGENAIDRSPCGTGTSARMAQMVAKGQHQIGEKFIHESVIGSQFIGIPEDQTTVGSYPAIIPSIEGSAYVTGLNWIHIDSHDPFPHGFQTSLI